MTERMFLVSIALAVCPLFAAAPNNDMVVTLNGTVSYSNGVDCLSEANNTVTLAATFNTTMKPTHLSAGGTLVTYNLPPGAVRASFSGGGIPNFTSNKIWTAKFSTKGQTLELEGESVGSPLVEVFSHTKLQKRSWSKAILKQPVPFSPSPQDVDASASSWSYTESGQCNANFFFAGTASN